MTLSDGKRTGSRIAAQVVALLLILFIAGCGSGSSNSQLLSKSQFVAQGDASCRRAEADRREVTKEAVAGVGEGNPEEEQAFTEALLAPVKRMTEELSGLDPPKGEEKQVKAITAAFEASIRELEANRLSLGTPSAFGKADRLAVEYGLTDCVI